MRYLTRFVWLLAISTSLFSCRKLQTSSAIKNIYSSDETDISRRHEATALEINWTIHAGGCSGVLISPTLILTANHCALKVGSKIKSGWSVLTRSDADIEVSQVLEANTTLDYMIVAVKWLTPMPSSQTFPPFVATDSNEIYNSRLLDDGDRIFTVGFPTTKPKSGMEPTLKVKSSKSKARRSSSTSVSSTAIRAEAYLRKKTICSSVSS